MFVLAHQDHQVWVDKDGQEGPRRKRWGVCLPEAGVWGTDVSAQVIQQEGPGLEGSPPLRNDCPLSRAAHKPWNHDHHASFHLLWQEQQEHWHLPSPRCWSPPNRFWMPDF